MSDTQISQDVLDEAMMPELSEDFFKIEIVRSEEVQSPEGQPCLRQKNLQLNVQIKPLKVKYQKQFAKAFAPIVDTIAMELASNQYEMGADGNGKTIYTRKGITEFSLIDWLAVASALLEQVEVLPRLIQILCHNDGQMVTDEELDESTMQSKEMQAVIVKFCKKSGDLERQVADFFESALPLAKSEVLKLLEVANGAIKNLPNSTTTASSKPSVETIPTS